jgi:hypothetical protein
VMHISPLMSSRPLLPKGVEHPAYKKNDLEDLHFREDE